MLRTQVSAELSADFARIEPQVINFIRAKAARWSHRGAGEYEDLVQEGRLHLVEALEKYDPQRGKLHVYLGKVLDFQFHMAMQAALRQKRVPYVWEHGDDGWGRVPYPPLSIDQMVGDDDGDGPAHEGASPEDLALTSDQRRLASQMLMRLHLRLNPLHAKVLDCTLRPPSALMATTRNLTGEYHVQTSHIAIYLGCTRDQVSYALKVIRRELSKIAQRMSEEGHEC